MSLQIPASLNLRLPEIHFVAPVAFSDTVASDFVIARGQGFDDPNAVLKLAGNTVSSPTLVTDTEIRFIPGARTAGSYQVEVPNQLGFTRDKAKKPDLTVEMRLLDESRKPTLPKPEVLGIKETQAETDPAVPLTLPIPFNREGTFTVELKATDKLTGKEATAHLPIRVSPLALR